MANRTLPFDTSMYDKLPVSVLIYETKYREDGSVNDFIIVYANDHLQEDWEAVHPGEPFVGKGAIEVPNMLNEYVLRKMDEFREETPTAFSTYMQQVDGHVHFQPLKVPRPFGGFMMTNISEYEESTSRAHFLRNVHQMENVAILLRKVEGSYEVVDLSEDFAKLMECESVEQAKEMMQGSGFIETTHPDDRLMVKRMLRRRRSREGGTDLTIRKITAKGNTIWCSVHYAFINDFNEHYVYITYFNVTVWKEYEERLRTAYMSMGDNFYQVNDRTLGQFRVNLTRDKIEDMQGGSLYATDSFVRPYSEVMKMRSENYPIESEREKFLKAFDVQELLDGYLKGRTQVSQMIFSKRRDDRYCFAKYTASLTRHPLTGDVVAFITEQECNDAKVDETLLEKILARQFDMVCFITNGEYGVVVGDESLIEKGNIFPLSRSGDYTEWLENQVIPVLSGTDDQQDAMADALELETIEEELTKREPYVVNIVCNIDGEIYHKRFDFYLVDPEAQFYILLKSDTTEIQREQMERNEQLKIALKEAEQASVAKTAFLSRMSHEIRTPMNAIIGLDNIALQESNLSDEMKDHLDKIGSSARYLLTLINDILDMSRIESGRMTIRNEEFSFNSFLEQVNTMVDGQCRDRGLQYDCTIHGRVDEYYVGDDTKLKQVLINILGNAVKFTNPGGTVSLTVKRTAKYDSQSTMQFVIKDTGIGMEKEYLPKIFEAFSQEDDTNTSKYGGSGLGLAITKNIVEMMNGQITVDSEKGEGTTFTVTVPLKSTGRQNSAAQNISVRPDELNVLVVDDDPVALRHAQIVLGEIGIHADTCESGKEALEMIKLHHARREEYNLILVDLKMPEQDGVEVTREIRKLLGGETAIIILTAYSWADVEDAAIEAGVDSFMSKPLFATNVLTEFTQALQKKQFAKEDVLEPAELSGRRILLAEDMLINAEIMKQLLVMKEMEVEHAENGQLAVDAFSGKPAGYFDAILMDVRMPVMDGLAATVAIRALDHPDAKKIPIIAMTANAFDEDVQRSLQAGMSAHLSKPVEPEHLYQTLGELIARAEA